VTTDGATIPRLVAGFDKSLDGMGTATRATYDQAYHKSEFAHMGVSVPELRKLTRAAYQEIGGSKAERDDILQLAAILWDSDVFERRLGAVLILALGESRLTAADLGDITLMLRDAPMWSLVDPLSGDVAGRIVLRDRKGAAKTLDAWSRDDDFWLRRSSMLALLPGVRADKPDLARFGRYADRMLEEKEFFIRKAIGWVLREIASKDPEWVAAWVGPRIPRMSGVTFREAVRKLPTAENERLTAAYQAKAAA
jgi:3-methyladenine DNA glycosylase AlkD